VTVRARSHRRAGFTLLEVVLAMTALGMVTAIVYAAFNLGVRAVEKGQVVVVGAQRARAASDVMRRQLKSMVPYPCRPDEDSDPIPYFEVGQNPPSLSFITAAGLHGGSGMEHVRYEVRGDPPQLILVDSPVFLFLKGRCSDVVTRDTTEAVLLDGFRSIDFQPQAYADDKWSDGDGVEEFGLPRSIHVRVEGMPGASASALGSGEIPVVANLESEDGWRAFEQFFAGGEETTVPGETPPDQEAGAADSGSDVGSDSGADHEDAEDAEDAEEVDE
jgi:prepilin-type N-terminal cleavage/methylation domain-containing protein